MKLIIDMPEPQKSNLEERLATAAAKERLEELRLRLRAEDISMGELLELQGLADYIEASDVELAEAAGIDEQEFAKR